MRFKIPAKNTSSKQLSEAPEIKEGSVLLSCLHEIPLPEAMAGVQAGDHKLNM